MSRNELIDIDVTLKHETERAWLVEDDAGTEAWIAKSLGELSIDKDGKGTLTVPQWVAEEKELS